MKIQQFLDHHGIATNPFADEDAQTDLVFKGACIRSTFHPAWDKIYGEPSEPATSVVFGEKGSGKTALRLQIARRLTDYNAEHPDQQVFVVHYDDFNPFLDRFRDRFSGGGGASSGCSPIGGCGTTSTRSSPWRHAIGRSGVEVRQARHPAARDEPLPLDSLDRCQARDLLLLAACYDQSTAESPQVRWRQLRRKLRFSDVAVEVGHRLGNSRHGRRRCRGCSGPITGVGSAGRGRGWRLPPAGRPGCWRLAEWQWKAWRIARNIRVLNRTVNPLRQIADEFPGEQLVGQPAPGVATDRRSLRTPGQAPGRAPRDAIRRDRRPRGSRRRALPDQRLDRTDAGVGLADAGQQVSQASGHGRETAAADRVGAAASTGRTRTSTSGPGWTSRT